MRKIKKKLGLAVISIAMLVFMQAMLCFAADGTLQFSDPTGKAGENITVTVKMNGNGAPIGDGDATLSYDAAKLEFVSGTNATGGDGTITLSASGTGTETELNYEIVFKALAEGTSTIEVTSSTAYLFSDETLNLQHGNSTVTIEGVADGATATGVEVTGPETVDVAGITYTVYNDFSDALVPEGFTRSEVSGEGFTYNGVQQDASGKQFIFGKKEGSDDTVMLMVDETEGFILAAPAMLTGDQYIYILGVMDGSSLPDTFGETTLDLNGSIFPVWQDSENTSFYIVNALGPSGEISFYQYDTVDETYQRYITKEIVVEKEEETPVSSGLIDKVKAFVDKNLIMVAAVVAAVLCLLILIVIIQGVMLGNKKAELEDLQEDMGFDLSRSKKKSKKQSREEEIDTEDDFEDEFEDDDYDEYDDEDDDYGEYDDEEDDDYDEYDDEDDDYDEYDDEDDEEKSKYDIDFIDL